MIIILDDHFLVPLKQQAENSDPYKKKGQLHSAVWLEAIYLAFRNELLEIAMNKSCLFTIASRQITGTAHINTAWERKRQKPD